jgi:aminoglycoside phosphotransferase family enzyme
MPQVFPAAPARVTLADKVAFLSCARAYPFPVAAVGLRETHMSFVFLAGDRVYKLKKPVWFPYLDFSSLDRREAACRAELALNRRLAGDVYLDVVPLTASAGGLALGGDGDVVDWLVVMRRLDESRMLDHAIASSAVDPAQLDRLTELLARFYRRAERVMVSPDTHLAEWRRSLDYNRKILMDRRVGVAAGLVRTIDRIQRRFLAERRALLVDRVLSRQIVDGHGDLRPEHIWLGDPPRIIDCLEFNAALRANDPFDEIAFLSLECERLGSRSAGDYIRRRLSRALPHPPPPALFDFYRSHRAMLRARLALAHLLEPNPRTPEKWPALARIYLRLAAVDAWRLARHLRRRGDR